MPCSVWLTVPFKSLLSINTELALANPKQTGQAIEKAVSFLKSEGIKEEIHSVYLQQKTDNQRYRSLEDSGQTFFSSPVFEIDISEYLSSQDLETFKITEGHLKIHDDMISILVFKMVFDPEKIDKKWLASDFESHLSSLAESIIQPLHGLYITPIIEALSKACRKENGWLSKRSLVTPKSVFRSDEDLSMHPYPKWDKNIPAFLWAARLYILDEWNKKQEPLLERLGRRAYIMEGAKQPTKDIYIAQGTCFVTRESSAKTFLQANSTMQFFYCLFDSLNKTHSRLYNTIGNPEEQINLTEATEKFDKIQTLIAYVQNELGDAIIEAQGLRRKCMKTMNEVFGIHELITIIEKRTELLGAKIERQLQSKRVMQEKLIKALLFIVGATGVYNLFVDLYMYSFVTKTTKTDYQLKDTSVGILDAIPVISFDTFTNILLLMILLGALAIAFKKHE